MTSRHRKRRFNQPWHPQCYAGSYHTPSGNRSWLYRPELLTYSPPVVVDRAGFACWTGTQGWQEPRSQFFGVEYVVSGDAWFGTGRARVRVGPGTACVVHRGRAFAMTAGPCGYLHKRYVYLTGSMLDMLLHSFALEQGGVAVLEKQCWFESYFKRVAASMGIAGQPAHKTHALMQSAFELLSMLASCTERATVPTAVLAAMEYLSRNLTRRPALPEVAAHTGVSLFHLLRLFRTSAGQSPMRYHASRRLEYARSLLDETTMSIKEIAASLGYSDPFHFTNQFRKHCGVSPREFRRQSRPASPRP